MCRHSRLFLAATSCLVALLVSASPVAPVPAGAEASDSLSPPAPGAARARPAVLTIANRDVFTFRASAVGYTPEQRLGSALDRVEEIVRQRGPGEVSTKRTEMGTMVQVDGKMAFFIVPGDLDAMTQETLEQFVDRTCLDLEKAVRAAREQRSLSTLIRGILLAILATVVFILSLRYLRRLVRWSTKRLEASAQRRVERLKLPHATITSQIVILLRFMLRALGITLGLILAYSWLAFTLNQFPYTSPWGDQLGDYLSRTVVGVLVAVLKSVPGLLMVVIIVTLARIVVRWVRLLFDAVRAGRLELPGVDADTAMPTQRLVVIFIWVLALALLFPFIPGSGGPAFKGISLLFGLMVSLGASSVVGQAASGYILMYSRALRPNDYIRIGEYEGTIVSMSMLSTKLRTPRDEEINVPNTVIVTSITKNYTRLTRDTGAVLSTSVTIGYGTPWRQVHAMLIEAAGRTAGIREEAKPRVVQESLEDFYVQYTVLVRLQRADERIKVRSELHAHIQDVFNEHGVQIMSPHYESDPAAKVWVPRDRWHEPPGDRGDV